MRPFFPCSTIFHALATRRVAPLPERRPAPARHPSPLFSTSISSRPKAGGRRSARTSPPDSVSAVQSNAHAIVPVFLEPLPSGWFRGLAHSGVEFSARLAWPSAVAIAIETPSTSVSSWKGVNVMRTQGSLSGRLSCVGDRAERQLLNGPRGRPAGSLFLQCCCPVEYESDRRSHRLFDRPVHQKPLAVGGDVLKMASIPRRLLAQPQKRERVATHATPETMKETFGRVDVEGRRLLRMKGERPR